MSEKVRKSRSGIKYTTEEVRNIIQKNGYEWLDDEYINSKTKLTIKDKDGYIYCTRLVGVIENRDLDFVGQLTHTQYQT